MTKEAHDYIYTYSGQVIDPENPTLEQIKLIDIAYGLSGIMRYNAQTRLSVLRHSIALSQCCENEEEELYALLHDAAEAYMLDVPVPLKRYVNKKWKRDYDKFSRLILQKYKCSPIAGSMDSVWQVDKDLCEYEMNTRERFEDGSQVRYPILPLKLTKLQYRILDDRYMWDLSEAQLIKYFLFRVRELAR